MAKRTISVATERIVMATEVFAVVILRAQAFAEYSHKWLVGTRSFFCCLGQQIGMSKLRTSVDVNFHVLLGHHWCTRCFVASLGQPVGLLADQNPPLPKPSLTGSWSKPSIKVFYYLTSRKERARNSEHSGFGFIANGQFCVELCRFFDFDMVTIQKNVSTPWSWRRRMCLHHGHAVDISFVLEKRHNKKFSEPTIFYWRFCKTLWICNEFSRSRHVPDKEKCQ